MTYQLRIERLNLRLCELPQVGDVLSCAELAAGTAIVLKREVFFDYEADLLGKTVVQEVRLWLDAA